MNYTDLRIIFFGTPEFAVASLHKLVTSGCNVAGVVTAPDKPAGRGMTMQQSDVKKYAAAKGLNILQPEKLKASDFVDRLAALRADIQVVVAFRMLPEIVWNMPPKGTINVHGSLLPQYRGAAPINWAIINGEKETGVTTFKLKHEIDTGDMLLSKKIKIGEDENAGTIYNRLKEAGAELLLETIKGIAENNIEEMPQPAESPALRHAPKLTKETGKIDWKQSTQKIYDLIRGLSPYPTAFTELNGKRLKVFSVRKEIFDHTSQPGELSTDGKTFLKFFAEDGAIEILELQAEGKSKMKTEDFLRGFRVK